MADTDSERPLLSPVDDAQSINGSVNGDAGRDDAKGKGSSNVDASSGEPNAPDGAHQNLLSACYEMKDLIILTGPLFVGMVAWVVMKTTDTALLGHVGSRYLDASSYSDLWTQSSGVFIMGRVLSIFASQAYGAGNNQLVGVWLQISIIILGCLALFVVALWAVTGPVLRGFGVKETLVRPAWFYSLVLMAAIPPRILNSQLNQFFQSQRIMAPAVAGALVAMVFNVVFGLVFVLGIPFSPNPGHNGFGFEACPIVTMAMEWIQLLVVYVYYIRIKGAHKECWNGWDVAAVTKKRVTAYLKMYVPAALAIGSDFWRVAAIGAVAGTLGNDDLGVFNSSYRILWICLTLVGSLAGAVGIKLGQSLGRNRPKDAKFTTMVGLALALAILVVLALITYSVPRQLGMIFSSDKKILDTYEDVRIPLATTMLLMNFSVALERVPMMMGRTRAVMVMGLVGSWVGQVPGVLIFTKWVHWSGRDRLLGLYTGMSVGYGLLVLLYSLLILTSDWERYAREAVERAETKEETTALKPGAKVAAMPGYGAVGAGSDHDDDGGSAAHAEDA